ncbi:MAG: hypothetical protein AB3N20_05880 [Rhizobiaceae bacterium]
MTHHADRAFWVAYHALPEDIRTRADRAFERLRSDPKHPSLHFKRIGTYWSARVSIDYRALAVKDGDDFIWFWIGSHADYDKLIG